MKNCSFCEINVTKRNKLMCIQCSKRYNIENYDLHVVKYFTHRQPVIESVFDNSKRFLENDNSVVLLFYAINIGIILPLPVWTRSSYLLNKFNNTNFKMEKIFRYNKHGARFVIFDNAFGENFYEIQDFAEFNNWVKVFIDSRITNTLSELLCMNKHLK
tara:strand:+ start:855 stop:1331 length:477 start_codon:yes stop_codon:yes gene_type:complete